ncbi:MAG: hypothetical protein HWN67_11345 [Candidatus Helarchaeota archaeon]|nr:hypothetical protein [Candidatus Helarchaeota archaeon]
MKNLTNHSKIRIMERGIKCNDIITMIALVKTIYRTGIKFYYCREKDIPPELRNENDFQKLIGMTVLMSHNGTIITAYRNMSKKAIRKIKKKNKRRKY